MKHFIHSFQLILFLVFSIGILACHKEESDAVEPSKTLISNITCYDKDGSQYSSIVFKYDAIGRLIEKKSGNQVFTLIEYAPGKVIVKETSSNGPLDITTTTYTLNDQSLAIAALSNKDNVVDTFTYDQNGYRKTSYEVVFHSALNTTYTLSNQNYVLILTDEDYFLSALSNPSQLDLTAINELSNPFKKRLETQNTLKSATGYIDTWRKDYEFYNDHINTIDIENMGIYFLGKQNLNPVKREVHSSEEMLPVSQTYTYEYDDKGRISKKIYESGIYDVFTYVP